MNITNTHEIASGGPPGLRPKSSASNSWISPMIGRKPQRRLRTGRFRANPTHTLRLHPGLRLSHLLRLQTRARRHRLEARGLAVPFWPLAALAQDEEPGMRDCQREAEEDWGSRSVIAHENWRAHEACATFGRVSEPGGTALRSPMPKLASRERPVAR
jgi:hypothetical protein